MNKPLLFQPSRLLQVSVLMLLSFALFAARAESQVDSDNDGLTDIVESNPFVLTDGQLFFTCPPGAMQIDPCVHPNAPDVFVILKPAVARSLLPINPLSFIVNLSPTLGVHQMSDDPASAANQARLITAASPQKAIRISESLDINDTIWGRSLFQGTPNTAGEATVFTLRIQNSLDQAYVSATGNPAPQKVVEDCIKHVIAHEGGHNENIASVFNSRFGGNHYSTREQVVMSQSATVSVKGSRVTVNCPDSYASPDAADFQLN